MKRKIRFKTVGHLADMAGVKELDVMVEGSTVKDFLLEVFKHVDESFGRFILPSGKLSDVVTVLKNGKNIYLLDGLETKIEDGDVISVMHPSIGG